jgi:hypothetical protein
MSWHLSGALRRSDSPFFAVEEDENIKAAAPELLEDAAQAVAQDEQEEVEENIMIEDEPMGGARPMSAPRPRLAQPQAERVRQPKSARGKPLLSQIIVSAAKPSGRKAISAAQISPDKRRMASSQMATLPSSPLDTDPPAQALKRHVWRHAGLISPRASNAQTLPSSFDLLPSSWPVRIGSPLGAGFDGGRRSEEVMPSPMREASWSAAGDVMCARSPRRPFPPLTACTLVGGRQSKGNCQPRHLPPHPHPTPPPLRYPQAGADRPFPPFLVPSLTLSYPVPRPAPPDSAQERPPACPPARERRR